MPTKEQIETVLTDIEDVISRRYIEGDGDMCACRYAPEGGGNVGFTYCYPPEPGEAVPFASLDDTSKVELLTTYVGWEGFDFKQDGIVIQRVLDGKDRDFWMDGIEVDVAGALQQETDTMADLKVESQQEKDERHKHLLFKGMPLPKGWSIPVSEPPDYSRPDAQQRAAQDIESLQAAEFESWRRIPFEAGAAIEPGKTGRWKEMTEFGKLDIMQQWIDWEGVSEKDRATLIAVQLDIEKLSPEVRGTLLQDAGVTSRGSQTIAEEAEELSAGRFDLDFDEYPSPEEFRLLLREMRDNESQRPLHEKGVRYEDEEDRHLHEAAGPGKSDGTEPFQEAIGQQEQPSVDALDHVDRKQRVTEGARMPVTEYEEALDAAANRGSNRSKGKEGPER